MNQKAMRRLAAAIISAAALSLFALPAMGPQAVSAAVQATPMPSPAVTPMPSATVPPSPVPAPMPNPAVTPAGNPVPSAPAPGTDMLNSNPNGSAWLQKFNRVATPDPNMRAPRMTVPPTQPAKCTTVSTSKVKTGMKTSVKTTVRTKCTKPPGM